VDTTTQTVALLGATGSIGRQTLDVLDKAGERYELVAVSASSRIVELIEIARRYRVPVVVVEREADISAVREALPQVTVLHGEDGLRHVSASADIVVNAVVGFAGVPVTLAALEAGRRLALANKESLIAAAPLVQRVRARGEIVPVDSEHCAIHQCLAGHAEGSLRTLWLTASGGPFRGRSKQELRTVSVADALAHPTWSMGAKITIDSSTLMNKGLEVIEAAALFDVTVDQIDVVVHPQSIVHSMVEFVDSSVIAQLSAPDMRLPISYALSWPTRLRHDFGRLDWHTVRQLDFEPPDREAFPALNLAYDAARHGGAAPAWLSAANEVAVAAFLEGRIAWHQIAEVVAATMDQYRADPLDSEIALYQADWAAREFATANLPT
jgi:1-deoxy-D-xylulose-5-phosphate reductoisomerase